MPAAFDDALSKLSPRCVEELDALFRADEVRAVEAVQRSESAGRRRFLS